MADIECDPSDMSWVSEKLKSYRSIIRPGSHHVDLLNTHFRNKPRWAVYGMKPGEDIATWSANLKFTMYQIIFEKMLIVPPFTPFQRDVLRYIGVAPSQLHPNAWAFEVL